MTLSIKHVAALATLAAAGMAQAGTVSWTDWTSAIDGTPLVTGSLTSGGSTIGVTFNGAHGTVQTNGGTNYWNPDAPYLSATVGNAPPASDIIELTTGGTATITFTQAVVDPLIALVSWNGNTVDFGVPIEVLSFGAGFWGNGTPVVNAGGTGFFGSGEVHGVIRLPGTYTSISFRHTSENWHGLTVGVVALADNQAPEPSSVLLAGLALAGAALRRRATARR